MSAHFVTPAGRNGTTPGSSLLQDGTRVVITAGWHPWKGYSGTLREAPKGAAFPWVVELDQGYGDTRAAVRENEIKRV